jgi:ABC-2 type transport system ATP-binding protein
VGWRRRLDLAAGLDHPAVRALPRRTDDRGLDPTSRVRMWEIIREPAAGGAIILLTTQYLDEADELADRIVVTDHGRAIAVETSGQLKTRIASSSDR